MAQPAQLDSPLLAVIWQEQFARIAGVNLAFGDRLLLFCCTWLVYCADRVLDVVDSDTRAETGRHAIHKKGRPIWLGVSVVMFVTALVIAITRLNAEAWLAGSIVFILTAVHFAATHWWPVLRTRLWPKEWHVGLVFCRRLRTTSLVGATKRLAKPPAGGARFRCPVRHELFAHHDVGGRHRRPS